MDAVDTKAIIFRSDISKYIIIEHSHYTYIDTYFKYVYVCYSSDTVVTVCSISPTCTGQWRRPPIILKMGGNPKPVAPQPDLSEWAALLPGILNDAKDFSNGEILANLARASNLMMNSTGTDY